MNSSSTAQQLPQTLDFLTLFDLKKTAVELLQLQGFVQLVKDNTNTFTQIIVLQTHRNILYEFIDIALTPNLYKITHNCPLNTRLTHSAIQILSSLTTQFIQAVFGEDAKTQNQAINERTDYPLIEYIFRGLFEEEMQETSLAYLVKLVTPFIYQRAEKMLTVLNGPVSKGLINYFWSKSICQLIVKALQAEGEHDFYQSLKLSLVQTICKGISRQQNEGRIEGILQSFGQFIEGLVEKREDKYEREKFNSLIMSILSLQYNFSFVIHLIQKYPQNHRIKTDALHCIESYLRIHLPNKQSSKISNQSNNQVSKPIQVSQSFISQLIGIIIPIKIQAFISQIRLQIVYYYKLIKALITLEPHLTKTILSKQFLSQTFKIMFQDSDNNIIHNYQKDVIVEGVRQSTQVYQILKDGIGLDEILRHNLTEKLSKKGYEVQLLLIGEAVQLKSKELQSVSEGWSDIKEIIKRKREFYSTIIGGDPRSYTQDRWGNLEGDNMQFQEQVVQVSQHNQLLVSSKIPTSCTPKLDQLGANEVVSEDGDQPQKRNQHYFDMELPLDSDKEEDKFVSRHSLEFSSNQNILIKINSMTPDILKNVIPIQQEANRAQQDKQNDKNLFTSGEIDFIEIESPQVSQQDIQYCTPSKLAETKNQLKQSIVQIIFSSQTESQQLESYTKQIPNVIKQVKSQKSANSAKSSQNNQMNPPILTKFSVSAKDQIDRSINIKYGLSLGNK